MTQRVIGLSILFVLVGGCAVPTQLTSGQLLQQIGDQFRDTTAFYDEAFTQGAISQAEYQQFAAFALHFQAVYRRLYATWAAGGDPVTVRDQLLELKRELLIFALKTGRT